MFRTESQLKILLKKSLPPFIIKIKIKSIKPNTNLIKQKGIFKLINLQIISIFLYKEFNLNHSYGVAIV